MNFAPYGDSCRCGGAGEWGGGAVLGGRMPLGGCCVRLLVLLLLMQSRNQRHRRSRGWPVAPSQAAWAQDLHGDLGGGTRVAKQVPRGEDVAHC